MTGTGPVPAVPGDGSGHVGVRVLGQHGEKARRVWRVRAAAWRVPLSSAPCGEEGKHICGWGRVGRGGCTNPPAADAHIEHATTYQRTSRGSNS